MSAAPIRIAIIGPGRMGRYHAEFLRQEPDVQVVATADHGSGRAQEFGRQWGASAYADYHRMLDEQSLDAVYICTSTDCHAEIALACAERNLHLYIEKPLDLNLHSASNLVDEVERRGLLAMNGFQWRYSPAYRQAEELIAGDPVALVALRWYWTRPPVRWMWDRARAGGQIVDQNIHLLNVGEGLAGEIDSVYAAYNQRQVNFESEFQNWDGYALTLRFKSGAVGTCAGTYGLFPEIQKGPAADFCLRDRMVRVTDRDVTLFTPGGVQTWQNNEPLHRGVNRAFVAALRENNPAHIRTPLRLGLRSVAVTLAANHSAQSGQAVTVDAFMAEQCG